MLAVTLFTQSPQLHGGSLFSEQSANLTCHFFHANFFHWACNAFCLWFMRPSPMQLFLAWPLASMATLFTTEPTIGFSAVLYAYIGMNIVRWRVSLMDWGIFILANAVSVFIPGIASGVHLAAFLLGLAVWYLTFMFNQIRKRLVHQ